MSIRDEAVSEVNRTKPWDDPTEHDLGWQVGFVDGAEWQASREPTDEEVEAARKAMDDHLIVTKHYRDGEIRWQGCETCHQEIRDYDEQERHEIRAALSAARHARGGAA